MIRLKQLRFHSRRIETEVAIAGLCSQSAQIRVFFEGFGGTSKFQGRHVT
jgi:hypothetical protein